MKTRQTQCIFQVDTQKTMCQEGLGKILISVYPLEISNVFCLVFITFGCCSSLGKPQIQSGLGGAQN